MPAGYASLAAWDHFVPRPCTRPRPVCIKWKGHASFEIVLECGSRERRRFAGEECLSIRLVGHRKWRRDNVWRSLQCREQLPPFFQLIRHVDASLFLGQEISPPGAEDVGPGLDGVLVSPRTWRHESRSP